MGDLLDRYVLLARTARRKRPPQLAGFLSRKIRNRLVPRLPINVDGYYRRRIPDDLTVDLEPLVEDTRRVRTALPEEERQRYRKLSAAFVDGQITFLNRTRSVSDPTKVTPDDDRITDLPRLWYLKLAAFEPLLWGIFGYETPDAVQEFTSQVNTWISNCVDGNPIGSQQGYLRGFWTPYAVSVRIVVLSRYGAWQGSLSESQRRFLYKNLRFLEANVERDVGGNHVVENGAALVIGGTILPEAGERFVQRGLAVLKETAESQFLADGYHFERSPMYHLAVTERLLTSLSVLEAAGKDVPGWLHETATDACRFMEYLRPPDSKIPLLNDSVFNQTHSLQTLLAYARLNGIDIETTGISETADSLATSDLEWITAGETTLLFDGGDSGPPHLMGHTHNDPCTVLLWRGPNRMVTDTGVFDYQPGERRTAARSVGSHNTVQVDDAEPVDYGGRFRMSGSISTSTTTAATDDVVAVSAAYRAGERSSYRHRRSIYAGDCWILVWDDVSADTTPYISRLHAHPEVTVRTTSAVRLSHEDGPQLRIEPVGVDDMWTDDGAYYPEFGVKQERQILSLRTQNAAFGYFIVDPDASVELERAGSTPTTVYTNGYESPLPSIQP